jgi:hypothetical protein
MEPRELHTLSADLQDLVATAEGIGYELEALVAIERARAVCLLGQDPSEGTLYDAREERDFPQPPIWVNETEHGKTRTPIRRPHASAWAPARASWSSPGWPPLCWRCWGSCTSSEATKAREEESMEWCEHPPERLRFWTVSEPVEDGSKVVIQHVLVGACCECGEAIPERVLAARGVEEEIEARFNERG